MIVLNIDVECYQNLFPTASRHGVPPSPLVARASKFNIVRACLTSLVAREPLPSMSDLTADVDLAARQVELSAGARPFNRVRSERRATPRVAHKGNMP